MDSDLSEEFPLITASHETMAGQPRIRDTRITVAHILELLADGATPETIVHDWPELSSEAIEQALRYAASALGSSKRERIAG